MSTVYDTGGLLPFGLTALVVLLSVARLSTKPHAIVRGTLVGVLCGAVIYGLVALWMFFAHGTNGYLVSSWLVVTSVGGFVAGLVGGAEGLIASLIFRLFLRATGASEEPA